MSASMTEIRWHGRGGQGAKTACLLLADAAFASGKYVQGFPEYGPERMGAPITAYNRISDVPCTIHSNIYAPDYVVVVDESLLFSVDVTAGLKEGGYVDQRPYGRVTLTEDGNAYAAIVWRAHRMLRTFLERDLGVEPSVADAEACLMEHVLSPDTLERWTSYLEGQGIAIAD